MNFVSQIKEIKNKVSGSILFNENLAKHSWFNTGGPAKVVFRPKDISIQISNSNKFKKHTGWRPKIKFKKSVDQLLNYCRENY